MPGIFSSDSRTEASPVTQNAGFSEIGGAAQSVNISARGKKSAPVVNLLDAGAIASSFDFAKAANEGALRQVELSGSNASRTVSEAVKAVSESARTETENLAREAMRWAVIGIIGYAAVRALGSLKG